MSCGSSRSSSARLTPRRPVSRRSAHHAGGPSQRARRRSPQGRRNAAHPSLISSDVLLEPSSLSPPVRRGPGVSGRLPPWDHDGRSRPPARFAAAQLGREIWKLRTRWGERQPDDRRDRQQIGLGCVRCREVALPRDRWARRPARHRTRHQASSFARTRQDVSRSALSRTIASPRRRISRTRSSTSR